MVVKKHRLSKQSMHKNNAFEFETSSLAQRSSFFFLVFMFFAVIQRESID